MRLIDSYEGITCYEVNVTPPADFSGFDDETLDGFASHGYDFVISEDATTAALYICHADADLDFGEFVDLLERETGIIIT